MRHRKNNIGLGMKSQHRRSTLANMVCSLIIHNRITTTVARAKAARRLADKMVTLAKKGALHHRRQALAFLRQKPAVKKLFTETGKAHADRQGGYTRIIRIGQQRHGDAAEMAILEWTGIAAAAAPAPETKKDKKKTAKAAPEKKAQPAEPKKEAKKTDGEKSEAKKPEGKKKAESKKKDDEKK